MFQNCMCILQTNQLIHSGTKVGKKLKKIGCNTIITKCTKIHDLSTEHNYRFGFLSHKTSNKLSICLFYGLPMATHPRDKIKTKKLPKHGWYPSPKHVPHCTLKIFVRDHYLKKNLNLDFFTFLTRTKT